MAAETILPEPVSHRDPCVIKGVVSPAAGRWPDIAERAGVSLATLYRHFPTLEELVTACGRLTMELTEPPTPERAAEAFSGARTREERIERLVAEQMVNGRLTVDQAATELDRRADAILAKRRWMLDREAAP